VWLADGSELLLIGVVTRNLSKEWNLTPHERASVVSVVFIGVLVGNALCGPCGDRLGRRLPILLSYLGIGVFSMLSALSGGFHQLAGVRLLVGLSFGLGQPACAALISETTPRFWRMLTNSFAQMLFVVGELFSAVLVWCDDPLMRDLHWRRLFILGALPSVACGILAVLFLPQSPFFHAALNEHEQAQAVLQLMRDDNRRHGVCVDYFKATSASADPKSCGTWGQSVLRSIALIWSCRMLYSTCTVIYSLFTLNVVFYGCLYAFPQVVSDVDMGLDPAMALVVGALLEIPGSILAVLCGMFLPRKPVMSVYLVLTGASLMAFALATRSLHAGEEEHWSTRVLLHSGFVGIKCFSVIGFVVIYQYATEIYPTIARTTGTAACVAGGRVGGMMAPLIFERCLHVSGTPSTFFAIVAAGCLINLVLVALLPFETFGRPLDDETPDEHTPLVPSN